MNENTKNNLLDGKYQISDLVDIPQLTKIFTKFSKATDFTVGLIDNYSLEVIIKTGWRNVCEDFHRADKKACEICKKSNEILFTNLKIEKSINIVECAHGLYDIATPIIIEGKHIANLVTGQLLMQKPDISQFKQRAKQFGFDEQSYINALLEVPIINKEKVKEVMSYLAEISVYIAKEGLNKLRTNKLNEELIVAKEAAEESNKLKTEFLHNISHEIRTPMNGILGFTNFLNNKGISEETKNQYIEIIQNSGKQLLRIIDDILEISQLGTKQIKTIETEVCLNDLFSELFVKFEEKAKENRTPLSVKYGTTDENSVVITDRTKLYKIINNLLENAIKFTNKGYIEFGYSIKKVNENIELELYVKDTGIGIKPENQEIIFKRFSSLSRHIGGIGLGLSIAIEYAELLDGEIKIQSEKGNGATFFVTIPYRSAKSNSLVELLQTANKTTQNNNGSHTVLIVEDEEINYLYINILLKNLKLDLKILRAKNGKEAVDMCKDISEINLVLMDIKMPIMNGLEATEIIKSFRPNLRIVAQTAYSTNDERKLAFEAGCDDFISKPISKDVIKDVLIKYLLLT